MEPMEGMSRMSGQRVQGQRRCAPRTPRPGAVTGCRSRACSAAQARGLRGAFVGRRSLVSSSSARWANSASDHPSARAMQSPTCHVGLALPDSISRSRRTLIPAASASASCLTSLSSRRRPIARPIAACGVGLLGTREASRHNALVARNYSSGMTRKVFVESRVGPRGENERGEGVRNGSGPRAQRHVERLAVACLDRLGERGELREPPPQCTRDPVDGALGEVRASVLDMRDAALVLAELQAEGPLGDFELFPAQADSPAECDLGFLGGVGHPRNPRCNACSWLWTRFHIDEVADRRGCSTFGSAALLRYSISPNRSAGVVPMARVSRRNMVVVGSRRAFSILLMCATSTPLRRDRTTCEIPAASRETRRFPAS